MADGTLDEARIRSVVANHISFFRRFGQCRGGEVTTIGQVDVFRSDVRRAIFNGAFCHGELPSSTEIEGVLAYFHRHGVPFTWWALPSESQERLSEALRDAGLAETEHVPGMALTLRGWDREGASLDDLKIKQVESTDDFHSFYQTLNAGDFQYPPDISREISRVLDLRPTDSRFRAFLGYVDGVPVATSMRFLSDGAVGIYGISTIPSYRGRGIGTAMTAAAVRDGASQSRSDFAVLTATAMGLPIYERMGFEKVCTLHARTRPSGPRLV